MRYLGIDFGTKKIGLAITDPAASMVLPYETLVRSSRKDLLGALEQIVRDERIEAVVMGLPLDLQGQETLITRQSRNFAAQLVRRTSLPLFLINEALTSFDAQETLLEAGVKSSRRKKVLDQMAAVRIVEFYLHSPDKAERITL